MYQFMNYHYICMVSICKTFGHLQISNLRDFNLVEIHHLIVNDKLNCESHDSCESLLSCDLQFNRQNQFSQGTLVSCDMPVNHIHLLVVINKFGHSSICKLQFYGFSIIYLFFKFRVWSQLTFQSLSCFLKIIAASYHCAGDFGKVNSMIQSSSGRILCLFTYLHSLTEAN